MLKEIIEIIVGLCIVALVFVGAVWLLFFTGDYAVPIAGCVVEKTEAGTGYQYSVHVLELSAGAEEHIYITTSPRVYNVVVPGACYEFTGPRSGTSYNGVRAVEQ
jgi:hypothetical protein